ncbi:hypothetical protein ACUXHY_004796 [Cytobacillus horneckiae]|nr:hypothetical protein [Cytobacillus horneckiae]MEC1156635.1 hypothetical protein [Cytobacillus horneckiae]MED2939143.1 hypothetical protein [Cytobacillus horneckiae]
MKSLGGKPSNNEDFVSGGCKFGMSDRNQQLLEAIKESYAPC